MRSPLLVVSSLPIVIAVAAIGLWQGLALAEEEATTPEVVTTPSLREVEAGNDHGNQVTGDNENTLELKQAKTEDDSKNRRNNENLFILFMQVLVSAK